MALPNMPFQFTNGATADANQMNQEFQAILAQVGATGAQGTYTGNLDGDNLATLVRQQLGVSDSTNVRHGSVGIPGAESTSSATYTLLNTPDRVQNVVVPSGGLVAVLYRATWQASTPSAARAAVFIGANQLKVVAETGISGTPAAVTEAACMPIATNAVDAPLVSCPIGLMSVNAQASFTGDVTTGQATGVFTDNNSSTGSSVEINGVNVAFASSAPMYHGGWCIIENLAAGTYDFSVRFKASAGSVTAKNRRLYVVSSAP